MTPLTSTLVTISSLARDTFRQAMATRLFWIVISVSVLAILLCSSVGIEQESPMRVAGESELYGGDGLPLGGPNPRPGHLTLAFGAVWVPLFRDGSDMAGFLQVVLARWVAGAVGTLLVLIWTAGFLPDFLHPSAAAVLLAKPVPRRDLLLGKVIGVLGFVTAQATLFVGGTWLALGFRTGLWPAGYLWCIPILVLNFAIMYGASAVLAVWTRSTVVCVFGAIVFWFLCAATNYGRHTLAVLPSLASEGELVTQGKQLPFAVETGYWILPKPVDLALLLDHVLKAEQHVPEPFVFQEFRTKGVLHPGWSILSSLGFTLVALAVAARHFEQTDY